MARLFVGLLAAWFTGSAAAGCLLRGTGDLGLVVERASGSVVVVDTTRRAGLFTVEGLGDLSHASVVFSRDERYGYVFGRDGGLTKVDLLCGRIAKRIIQAGNSIGGAISQDGRLIAVSNYEPGGVKVFDAESLAEVADVPAILPGGARSKVVGLVDAPGQRFVYSLYDGGEIRILDLRRRNDPVETTFRDIGRQPYDGLITPDGRYYIAGLFGEDGLARLDLWDPGAGVKRILAGYGKGKRRLPVYKMPHLEGWAIAGGYAFLPAVGYHEVLVVDTRSWRQIRRIPVAGQPVFAVARPDGRQVWVNFALPDNDKVQVIDAATFGVVRTLETGKGTLHIEFAPRGEEVWVSVRDADVVRVYDTETFESRAAVPVNKPSGIFFTARAHEIGL